MQKEILKILGEKEILSVVNFHPYIERKKIIVYVPQEHFSGLLKIMSDKGAGRIGNYTMCSFRTEGKGTFKPGNKTSPYSGKKNKLSEEPELKLEMECDAKDLNEIISAMLNHHPYEEPAYEIHDFVKRERKTAGLVIQLKKETTVNNIVSKLGGEKIENDFSKSKIRKIAVLNRKSDRTILRSAVYYDCDCVLSKIKNKYKIQITKQPEL